MQANVNAAVTSAQALQISLIPSAGSWNQPRGHAKDGVVVSSCAAIQSSLCILKKSPVLK